MAILQVGLKSSVWPRQKRWYKSFFRTRLQLARRGQNVAKNSATLCVEGRAGGLKSTVLRDGRPWTRPSSNTVLFFRGCQSLNTVLLWLRPSPNTQFSARPPTRSAIFGHVLASPGQLEPSSAKLPRPSVSSWPDGTFKPNL